MNASSSSHGVGSAAKPGEDAHTTLSALEPVDARTGIQLPQVLSRRDLTVSLLLIVVYISNVTGVQFGGSATFLYWTLGLLTFLVPCAYVTQWLGRLFPGAGASYLWASRILGPKWGVFSAFCSWIPSVLVVVLGIQGSLLFLQYLVPAWFVTPLQQCIGIIGILLLVTAITCIPLRWLKYGLLALALFSLAIYASLGVAGIWWLWSKHPAAVSLSAPSLWQLNRSNMAVYGLVILAFLGVEVPLLLGGELSGGAAGAKRAMSYVWWGAGLTFAAYIIATFGLLVVVPPDQAGALSSGATALALVFGSLVGKSAVTIPVTASIGVSTYKLHGMTREKLVEQADHAMYRAKQGGRDQVCVAQLAEEAAQPVISSTTIEKSETTHVSTVQALTAAASARDRGTNAHAHRMVALAEETAHVLNRSEEEIHLIRLGALLHDIGKIGIPDAILHKPGSLTAEEWAVMRLHPRIGQHILSQAGGVFIALASIVVAHHERWDGQGYPAGLSGEAIPLAARILTVIDSYDAMTSRRVYRAAMSPLAARAELEQCAGSQYDPDVVAAFLKVLDTQNIMGAALLPPRTDTSPTDIGLREASLDSEAV